MFFDGIVTDRPDFTESARLVAPRLFQLESGFTVTRERGGGQTTGLPEALLRLGLTDRWEARVGLPNYEKNPTAQGLGDTYLGAKYRVGTLPSGVEVGLIPAVYLPTGKVGIRQESYQPEVKLVWLRELPADRSVSGMLYALLPREGGTRYARYQHTLSYGLPLGPNTACFIESATDFGQGISPAYQLHIGVTYQPNPRTQWDIHGGKALNRNAPLSFIAAGYSIRFDTP